MTVIKIIYKRNGKIEREHYIINQGISSIHLNYFKNIFENHEEIKYGDFLKIW